MSEFEELVQALMEDILAASDGEDGYWVDMVSVCQRYGEEPKRITSTLQRLLPSYHPEFLDKHIQIESTARGFTTKKIKFSPWGLASFAFAKTRKSSAREALETPKRSSFVVSQAYAEAFDRLIRQDQSLVLTDRGREDDDDGHQEEVTVDKPRKPKRASRARAIK